MKLIKTLIITLIASLAAIGAQAQSMKKNDWYGEVGYLGMKLSDNSDVTPKPKMARFVVGKDINENLSVEGMAGLTTSKYSWSDSGVNSTLSSTTYGIFAKPKAEIAQGIQAFARIGLARTSWKQDSTAGAISDSASKVAYGIGLQADFTKNIYGQLDYMKYASKNSWDAKGWSVSIGTRF